MKTIVRPAVAAGKGPWRIGSPSEAGMTKGGFVDLENKTFAVPLGESPEESAVRAHEYGHLALARSGRMNERELKALRKAGIDNLWIQAAADLLVNSLVFHAGVPAIMDLPLALPPVDDTEKVVAATVYLRAWQLNNPLDFGDYLTVTERKYLDEARRKIFKASKESLPNLLLALQKLFGLEPDEDTDDSNWTAGKGDGKSANVTMSTISGIPWCEMEMVELPPISCCGHLRSYTADYVGGFRYAHRALLPSGDGKCWGRKLKHQGGTLLIDRSGSMSIEPKHLARIIALAPHATIAAYDSDGGRKGKLVVFARRGKLGDINSPAAKSSGSGNGVDGPALRWLLRQPDPRLWICDGVVTGEGDKTTDELMQECAILCERGKVKRLEHVSEALIYLGQKEGKRS